ncbi:MAG: acetate kinase [Candidatus Omnitrophica bacterium]|nr:acetate kinase [Candidatus Omnitrophota bacterium]MCM8809160.1 acetate kinase [Candidatus Omnitrophota bacterium]MCM8811412.1 acetate kinase [Candidatus Omnitrophota bacterium]
MKILVINCGSSSIKFKLFEMPDENLISYGSVEKIGEEISIFKYIGKTKLEKKIKIDSHQVGLELIANTLLENEIKNIEEIKGVGHRVVHGGEGFEKSVIIDQDVIKKIEDYIFLAPLHNPHNLSGIKGCIKIFPKSIQVAAFDTAFHTTLPKVSNLYAIPYSFYEKYKIRKYGFHGISHRYVARRASEIMGKGKYEINAITCHLGNGCSITAVKNGRSFDTSMGLTPLEGLIMGTRPGDIDPGVILYFLERLNLNVSEVSEILNKKSGLLGVSEISNDFRNLLPLYNKEEKVTLAIDMFCYRLKKYIGSYMAALGKVDSIIFTGGIGENVPLVREKSLDNLELFGIILDLEKNKEIVGKEGEISKDSSKVKVFVIPTNEELRIAFDTYQLIVNSGLNQ